MACECFGKRIVIHEDDRCLAFLHKEPISPAHIKVMPKEHFPIIEQVPEELLSHLFNVANDISKTIFDKLNIQGTNFMVSNGIPAGQKEPHFSIDIIPRTDNDNIPLSWEPKKLTKEEMSDAEFLLKDAADKIFNPKEVKVAEEKKAVHIEKDNYLLKSLRRIP